MWRDFYYLATYTILSSIDEHWGSREVVLTHPTGHGWPEDLMPTVLDALGHFADREPAPALRRVYIHRCCLKGPDQVLGAMKSSTASSRARSRRSIDRCRGRRFPLPIRTTAVAGYSA